MRLHIFLFCLLVSFSSIAQLRNNDAKTTISNVTVFSKGATVERTAAVSIPAGRSEVTFSGLSNQLDEKSIQLNADADITLLSVQTSKDFLTERTIDGQEKSYLAKIKSLKDKINLDNKFLQVYNNEEQMLNKNEEIGAKAGVKTSELKGALDLHRQRLTEVYEKQLDIKNRIDSEQNQLKTFNEQLQEFSKKKDGVNNIVTAIIESKIARNVNFKLSYNVKDAGWYPSYDVRVSDVTKPLNILMNANVYQRSGETWKNVSLLLSTGNPNDNATPSQLQPWKLGFYDPSVSYKNQGIQGIATGRVTNENGEPIPGASIIIKGSKMGVSSDQNGFFKLEKFAANSIIEVMVVGYESKEVNLRPGYFTIALKEASTQLNEVVVTGYGVEKDLTGSVAGVMVNTNQKRERKEAMKTITVSTQYQPTTTLYKIKDKYDLETDGKTKTIGIKEFEVPANYNYLSVPKVEAAAFLNARIVNWQDYDLQSGEASLFYEGSYLGKTYIDLDAATDTLALSLGKDNGIKVSRKIEKEYSSKHFIGSNKTETRTFEITVRNTKRVPVNLTITDQVPVSVTKEIDVNDVKVPDAQFDKDTGIASWNFSLKASEEKKLQISYTVKYPKDKVVVLE
ncbi:MAG TPA: mucoidy inhibitor MuiA family protein [Hanamia sp.]|nr:mucoidy inhibitor MuiA family protein [Hanamia sp.]